MDNPESNVFHELDKASEEEALLFFSNIRSRLSKNQTKFGEVEQWTANPLTIERIRLFGDEWIAVEPISREVNGSH